MLDRIPTPGKENRVRIIQDDGKVIEGVLSYADDAAQEGSTYTKGNVLPDEVCTALGIDTALSEPKDAFSALKSLLDTGDGDLEMLINSVDSNRKPVVGTYSGNGASSRTINLGFKPMVVILTDLAGFSYRQSGIATTVNTVAWLRLAENGFTVYYDENGAQTNNKTLSFLYVAWRQ